MRYFIKLRDRNFILAEVLDEASFTGVGVADSHDLGKETTS